MGKGKRRWGKVREGGKRLGKVGKRRWGKVREGGKRLEKVEKG